MNTIMISIPLLLLLGVACSGYPFFHDNGTYNEPIISHSQQRRICAELCMSGLGGEPCGDDCIDIVPQGIPMKSQSESHSDVDEVSYHPRQEACPVLCANQLGYPLCGCNYTEVTTPFFTVDYLSICSFFCTTWKYQIYGCAQCEVYENMTTESSEQEGIKGISSQVSKKTYDWNSWCKQMCEEGEGGSACYCDLLPLALKIDD